MCAKDHDKMFVWPLITAVAMSFGVFVPADQAQGIEQSDPPPLPLHGIEGMGGIFSTYSAHLTNPAKEGAVLGLPSVGAGYVDLRHDRYLIPLTVTQTFWDRFELGFAWNYFDLGNLPEDIMQAHGIDIADHSVEMYNLNFRLAVVREGDRNSDTPWMPAITIGAHYKYNDTIEDIDRDLHGHLKAIGIEDNEDFVFTLYTSKMFPNLLRPVQVNAGARCTRAAHVGLLGFTEEYEVLPEGNVVVFLTDRLALAAEYRCKPDEYEADLAPLVQREDDWWTLCAAFVATNHLTVSGGYGHFGDVLNHTANDSWGVKVKWEF